MQGGQVARKVPVRLSVRLSVCLSVFPSVCQTRELWQNGIKNMSIFYVYDHLA